MYKVYLPLIITMVCLFCLERHPGALVSPIITDREVGVTALVWEEFVVVFVAMVVGAEFVVAFVAVVAVTVQSVALMAFQAVVYRAQIQIL